MNYILLAYLIYSFLTAIGYVYVDYRLGPFKSRVSVWDCIVAAFLGSCPLLNVYVGWFIVVEGLWPQSLIWGENLIEYLDTITVLKDNDSTKTDVGSK